jgi:hypothetical protein
MDTCQSITLTTVYIHINRMKMMTVIHKCSSKHVNISFIYTYIAVLTDMLVPLNTNANSKDHCNRIQVHCGGVTKSSHIMKFGKHVMGCSLYFLFLYRIFFLREYPSHNITEDSNIPLLPSAQQSGWNRLLILRHGTWKAEYWSQKNCRC